MQQELSMLGKILDDPRLPLMAILGGAKLSDKISVIQNLLQRVDTFLIGGGMAATFLKAQGYSVGASKVEETRLDFARKLLGQASKGEVHIKLPKDVMIAHAFAADGPHQEVPVNQIPEGWFIMDVGRTTLDAFQVELIDAKTVVWNGPMGVFEFPAFATGTRREFCR